MATPQKRDRSNSDEDDDGYEQQLLKCAKNVKVNTTPNSKLRKVDMVIQEYDNDIHTIILCNQDDQTYAFIAPVKKYFTSLIGKDDDKIPNDHFIRVCNSQILGGIDRRLNHESNETILVEGNGKKWNRKAFVVSCRHMPANLRGKRFQRIVFKKMKQLISEKMKEPIEKVNRRYELVSINAEEHGITAFDKHFTDASVAEVIERYMLNGVPSEEFFNGFADNASHFFTAKQNGGFSEIAIQYGYGNSVNADSNGHS